MPLENGISIFHGGSFQKNGDQKLYLVVAIHPRSMNQCLLGMVRVAIPESKKAQMIHPRP